MPVALSDLEKQYIIDHYPTSTAKEVVCGMKDLTGVYRREGAVWVFAADEGIRKIKVGDRVSNDTEYKVDKPMNNMKIGIEQFDLMRAMSYIDCNAHVLADKIRRLTGWIVTTDQVAKMITDTGMPEIYATTHVRRFLEL